MGARRRFIVLMMVVLGIVCAFSSACTKSSADQVVAPSGVAAQSAGSIPQGWPLWIEIPGKLDRIDLNPRGILPGPNGINPVDNRPVFRADSNNPGSDSPGTSLIYGHNYTDSNGAFVPFSALESVEPGDTIVVGTVYGELSYAVTDTMTVAKDELDTRTDDVYKEVPNQLVLITCDTVNGKDTRDNEVVFAQLKE